MVASFSIIQLYRILLVETYENDVLLTGLRPISYRYWFITTLQIVCIYNDYKT